MTTEPTNEPRVNPLCLALAWLAVNVLAAWSALKFKCCSPTICAWCKRTTRRQWLPAKLLGRRLRPSHGICPPCVKKWGRNEHRA